MITEFKIKRCAYLNTLSLEQAFERNGYKQTKFISNRFLGITNGGEFCYEVLWDNEGEEGYSKVFIDLNINDEPVGEW